MKSIFKCSLTTLVLLMAALVLRAQPAAFDVAQVDSLLLKGKRDVFFFVYTDWCRYCAAMKQTTFKDDRVVQLLKEHFYFVPFNAESKTDVKMNGRVYRYAPTGAGTGVHELAAALSQQFPPAFPFMGVLNNKGELAFWYNSYLNAKELTAVLNRLVQEKTINSKQGNQ